MTPEKLREKGNRWRELGQYDLANIYNQHAAAIEEVERLKGELDRVMGGQQHSLEHANALLTKRAEKAERRAEHWAEKCEAAWKAGDELTMQRMQAYRKAERLKGHAEAMYTGIKHDVKFCLLRPNEWAEKAADAYRAEFKEE